MKNFKYYLISGHKIIRKSNISCYQKDVAVNHLLGGQPAIEISGKSVSNGLVLLDNDTKDTTRYELDTRPICVGCED